jgi:hypothetical protein
LKDSSFTALTSGRSDSGSVWKSAGVTRAGEIGAGPFSFSGTAQVPVLPFEEQYYPVVYWAKRWGFSVKTVRGWFQDEYGPGKYWSSKKARLHHDYDFR